MSKHWKPRRPTVELAPSRIRRQPVREEAKVEPVSPEREMWGGVAGIILFAVALAVITVGIALTPIFRGAVAAKAPRFGQCYNSDPANCVLDGDTIHLAGDKLEIAGMDVPRIQDARCDSERSRGIEAAVKLADLLNSGKLVNAGNVRDLDGQVRTKLEVDGRDVGAAMVSAGVARDLGSGADGWCG